MSNPLRPLKYLPWAVLLQSAAVVIAIATVVDFGVLWLILQLLESSSPALLQTIMTAQFFASLAAAAYGIGALALLLTERFFREVVLTAETLWALIGCVILLYWLRSILPVPGLLMPVSLFHIVAITLGVFFTGKRYWR